MSDDPTLRQQADEIENTILTKEAALRQMNQFPTAKNELYRNAIPHELRNLHAVRVTLERLLQLEQGKAA